MRTTFKGVPVFLPFDSKTQKVLKEFRAELKNDIVPTIYVKAHYRNWPVKKSSLDQKHQLMTKKHKIEIKLKELNRKLRGRLFCA